MERSRSFQLLEESLKNTTSGEKRMIYFWTLQMFPIIEGLQKGVVFETSCNMIFEIAITSYRFFLISLADSRSEKQCVNNQLTH